MDDLLESATCSTGIPQDVAKKYILPMSHPFMLPEVIVVMKAFCLSYEFILPRIKAFASRYLVLQEFDFEGLEKMIREGDQGFYDC